MRSILASGLAAVAIFALYVLANQLSRIFGADGDSVFGAFFIEATATVVALSGAGYVARYLAPLGNPKHILLFPFVLAGVAIAVLLAIGIAAMVSEGLNWTLVASLLGLALGYVSVTWSTFVSVSVAS